MSKNLEPSIIARIWGMLPIGAMWAKPPAAGGGPVVAASRLTHGSNLASAMAVSTGDVIVGVIAATDGIASGDLTIGDGGTNTYGNFISAASGGTGGVGVYMFVTVIVTGGSFQFRAGGSALSGPFSVVFLRVTGANATPVDASTPNKANTSSGAAHTVTSGSISTLPTLAISGLCPNQGSVTTWAASSWTKEQEEPDNSVYWGLSVFSRVLSTNPGTTSATCTPTSTDSDTCQSILVIK